jgi:hypothetical protein
VPNFVGTVTVLAKNNRGQGHVHPSTNAAFNITEALAEVARTRAGSLTRSHSSPRRPRAWHRRARGPASRRSPSIGFNPPRIGQPTVIFQDQALNLSMCHSGRTSHFIFQAASLGILGAALLSGPYRMEGQTLALTTAATGLTLGSASTTVILTPLREFAPALGAAQNRAAPVILAIEGITGQPVHPLRINVFVGKPDATRRIYRDCSQIWRGPNARHRNQPWLRRLESRFVTWISGLAGDARSCRGHRRGAARLILAGTADLFSPR